MNDHSLIGQNIGSSMIKALGVWSLDLSLPGFESSRCLNSFVFQFPSGNAVGVGGSSCAFCLGLNPHRITPTGAYINKPLYMINQLSSCPVVPPPSMGCLRDSCVFSPPRLGTSCGQGTGRHPNRCAKRKARCKCNIMYQHSATIHGHLGSTKKLPNIRITILSTNSLFLNSKL